MNKKHSMQEFIDGKIAVRTGSELVMKTFLRICEKHGLKWADGDNPTKSTPWKKYRENTCVLCIPSVGLFFGDGRLTAFFKEIVRIDEIEYEKKTGYKVVIDSDGGVTTARLIINGKEVKTAKAKRNPVDKFNFRIGSQLAFDRLWQSERGAK